MIPASYAVIRFVPDPARNEPYNIGVVIWNDATSCVELNQDAILRVVRDYPHLNEDSFLYAQEFLEQQLRVDLRREQPLVLGGGRLFPLVLSGPLFTEIAEESEEALETELRSLVARVVQPPSRSKARKRASVVELLADRWDPLLASRRLERNHVFRATKSGNPRAVSFYANSNANIAVDILSLNIKDSAEIQKRADAQAFKVLDVRGEQQVNYVVHCQLKPDENYVDVNLAAMRSIGASGAKVFSDLEETTSEVESVLGLL